ncbi:hypothetical protein S40285_00562 [Stachybotrys chlorohalonatus IBT 40285]|uniref:Uncharacterized protein n=1 Tax=Stachybotrys chlorohalonatus (strain IBT 40285) TaxID=1283841 RepID=A0A084R2K3_STAC4|nr:hypothetical protein S40285_00562 [Stachybotrys chlorohalonata IBT 40285]
MDQRLDPNSMYSGTSWSTEALRGSLESMVQASQARPQAYEHLRAVPPVSTDATRTMSSTAPKADQETPRRMSIETWLDSPTVADPSPVIDAVSELFSTQGQSTVPSPTSTRGSYQAKKSPGKRPADNYHDANSSSLPSRPAQKKKKTNSPVHPNSSKQSGKRNHESPPYEIREIGAFARTPSPR